uniref:poly(ADP-ribose) glycohydrolase n=1 Tax=Syphacia muris TaxID=451379 RepID=A0A0N5AGM0_9BILA
MKAVLLVLALLCTAYAYKSKGAKICNFCKAFVGGIETAMDAGEQGLVQVGDKLCDTLTKGNTLLDPICRGLVDAELPKIIKWIENNESANTICSQLHLFMDRDIEFSIEEIEDDDESSESTNNRSSTSWSNQFKQVTLDNFIPGLSDHTGYSSAPIHRKRSSKNRRSFVIHKTAVVTKYTDKNLSLIRNSPGTPKCVVRMDKQGTQCGTSEQPSELSRMGAARRNSLYGLFDKMSEESSSNNAKGNKPCFSAANKDTAAKAKVEGFRSFADLYPDLKNVSKNDYVFIDVDSINTSTPPKPYPAFSSCVDEATASQWFDNDRYVKLPFAPNRSQYTTVKAALNQICTPLNSYLDLEKCLRTISGQKDSNFENVRQYFTEVLDVDLRNKYFREVIPFMAHLALKAPELITKPIPLLRRGFNGSITLSQQQVAVLLSHAFFSTYSRLRSHSCSLPSINFKSFFDKRNLLGVEKLHCIFHYFRCLYEKMPCGVITFRRQSKAAPNWKNLEGSLSQFIALTDGTIEDDGFGMLEIDFANKYIGGGVVRFGCVQEEIRFLICPELIASCIFCEKMNVDEALIISGAQRYSNYTGYGRSFKWRPLEVNSEQLLRDRFGRYLCEVVAIDALSYHSKQIQYEIDNVNRELQKAYIGFYDQRGTDKGIATGNWGCGVYRGDPQLKSLLQLIAASANHKPLCYFTFFNQKLTDELNGMYALLMQRKVTTGRLYQLICRFCSEQYHDSRTLFSRIAEWIQ